MTEMLRACSPDQGSQRCATFSSRSSSRCLRPEFTVVEVPAATGGDVLTRPKASQSPMSSARQVMTMYNGIYVAGLATNEPLRLTRRPENQPHQDSNGASSGGRQRQADGNAPTVQMQPVVTTAFTVTCSSATGGSCGAPVSQARIASQRIRARSPGKAVIFSQVSAICQVGSGDRQHAVSASRW